MSSSGVSTRPVQGCGFLRTGTFRKLGVPYFGVLVTGILLFRVLYWGPLFSETPKCCRAWVAGGLGAFWGAFRALWLRRVGIFSGVEGLRVLGV